MTKWLLQIVRSTRLLPLLAALASLLLPLEASALTRQNPTSGSFFASEWKTCRNDPVNNSDPLGLWAWDRDYFQYGVLAPLGLGDDDIIAASREGFGSGVTRGATVEYDYALFGRTMFHAEAVAIQEQASRSGDVLSSVGYGLGKAGAESAYMVAGAGIVSKVAGTAKVAAFLANNANSVATVVKVATVIGSGSAGWEAGQALNAGRDGDWNAATLSLVRAGILGYGSWEASCGLQAQLRIDNVVKNDPALDRVELSARPRYDAKLVSYGSSNRRPLAPSIEVGPKALASRTELLDTVVHEEVHLRTAERASRSTRSLYYYFNEKSGESYTRWAAYRFMRAKGVVPYDPDIQAQYARWIGAGQ